MCAQVGTKMFLHMANALLLPNLYIRAMRRGVAHCSVTLSGAISNKRHVPKRFSSLLNMTISISLSKAGVETAVL